MLWRIHGRKAGRAAQGCGSQRLPSPPLGQPPGNMVMPRVRSGVASTGAGSKAKRPRARPSLGGTRNNSTYNATPRSHWRPRRRSSRGGRRGIELLSDRPEALPVQRAAGSGNPGGGQEVEEVLVGQTERARGDAARDGPVSEQRKNRGFPSGLGCLGRCSSGRSSGGSIATSSRTMAPSSSASAMNSSHRRPWEGRQEAR